MQQKSFDFELYFDNYNLLDTIMYYNWRSTILSYNLQITIMSYNWQYTIMNYKWQNTIISYNWQEAIISYNLKNTIMSCKLAPRYNQSWILNWLQKSTKQAIQIQLFPSCPRLQKLEGHHSHAAESWQLPPHCFWKCQVELVFFSCVLHQNRKSDDEIYLRSLNLFFHSAEKRMQIIKTLLTFWYIPF